MEGYTPDRGDVVWLSFDPQIGREQSGRRPALTLSPLSYNQKTSLGIFCPIASQVKGYPFEVGLPQECAVSGVVLVDHMKSLDWKARNAGFICRLQPDAMAEALGKARTLLE